jgi:hypothetical protein
MSFGKQFHTAAALHRPANVVFGPAFSILAATTPDDLGAVFSSRQISGGLFNRKLLIDGVEKPRKQERPEGSWDIPPGLAARVRALRPGGELEALLAQKASEITDPLIPQPIVPEANIVFGSGAKEVWDALDALRDEPDSLRRNMFLRVAENTVRIADIVAWGRGSRVVEVPDMEWARAWTMQSAHKMYESVLKRLEEPKSHNSLCNYIVNSLESGAVAHVVLKKDCRKFTRKGDDFEKAIKDLIDTQQIRLVERKTGGNTARFYDLAREVL